MQHQIREPQNFAEMLVCIMKQDTMPNLPFSGVLWFCLDDALLGDKPIVLTAHRVLEQALEHTVSFLSDFAGNGICQHTKPE